MKKERAKKRYTAIAKVGYDKTLKNNICVLYRFNDIDNFLKFIQKKYPVSWINIYYKSGDQAGKLAFTWGKFKGLQTAY
jgi:hypothetical protein